MYYVVHHEDRDDGLEVRKANRPAHLEYIKGFNILAGGPTLSDDGERMTGSVIIVDLPDRAAADAFVRDDPYVKAGLFKASSVKRWHKVTPID